MSLTKTDPQFGEHLAGYLHQMFRTAGLSMNATAAVEKVRKVGEQMAATIEWAAERKAIQVAQKLQAAVSTGFTGLERKLDEALAAYRQAIPQDTGPGGLGVWPPAGHAAVVGVLGLGEDRGSLEIGQLGDGGIGDGRR